MKLTIKPNEKVVKGRRLLGVNYRYYLDDLEVTNSLTALNLTMGLLAANTAKMSFMVDDVDIEPEVLAELTAIIEERDKPQEDQPVPGDGTTVVEKGAEGYTGD